MTTDSWLVGWQGKPLVQERIANLGSSPVALRLPVTRWPLIHQYYYVETQSFN